MDDELDFTQPAPSISVTASAPFKAAQSRFYDKQVAARIFQAEGKEERFAAGQVIFVEDEKTSKGGLFKSASRMYYIADGEVGLTIGARTLDTVKAGEVVGEMAVISGRPRSATGTAKTDVTTYSMEAKELQAALGHSPEFALMLASVMYDRLRFIAAQLQLKPVKAGGAAREATVFDPALVAQLEAELPRTALVRYRQEQVIMKEGQKGTFMYLVKSGRVAIAVGTTVVEVVGPGGTFGEMAVVDQSPRTARAGTLEETELLQIDRPTLMAVVKQQPAIAMALLRGISDRLRHMNMLLSQ
ncbi:MAG TPA: cyclic nucleotide-binding domain-containing protein [Usitatibacter sp.]|nr:cyclic nucleotide-binding domain-containing protein [Usitatibacter sp.]